MKKIAIVRAAALGLALAAAPSALAAQTPDQEIQRSLDRAKAAGVPTTLLQSKVEEGKAKGVPMERIAAAVAHRLEVLQRVQQKLADQHLDTQELGVAGDAAQAGVSDAVLAKLASAAPRQRRAVAIVALTELVQAGRTPEQALEQVTDALARGPDALMNLSAQARGARGREGRGPLGAAGATGAAASGGKGGTPKGVPAGGPKGGTGMMGPRGKSGGGD